MDLFKFPFHADVWGTASEWLMILVTAGTAYLLWRTLKSQKEVQEAQNKLLEIEQFRVREACKPDIRYKYMQPEHLLKTGANLICIAVTNISANDALNVQAEFTNLDYIKLEPYESFPRNLAVNDEIPIYILFNIDIKRKNSYNFHFKLTYQDKIGTKYCQNVICWENLDDDNPYIRSNIPEIIFHK
jgi:hypothetical protein